MTEEMTTVRKHRFSLAMGLPLYAINEVRISYRKKIMTVLVKETFDEGKIPVHEWLQDTKPKEGVFVTYTDDGSPIYSYKFYNLEIVNDESEFSYEQSGVSIREIMMTWSHSEYTNLLKNMVK